jgi:hypothetical protein
MRKLRNGTCAAALGICLLFNGVSLTANDLGCEGEDGFGQSPPMTLVLCGGSYNCCESQWNQHSEETITEFCEDYGEPDWQNSDWTASESTNFVCDEFQINCVCIPDPR